MPRPHVALFLALACSFPIGGPAAAQDVAAWVAALDSARLDGPGIPAAGRAITVGHLELNLADGQLFPLRAADRVVGIFFVGTGEFAYTSSDPLEAATFRSSVKRASGYSPSEGKVGGAVPALILWSPDRATSLAGDEGWPEGDAPAAAVSRFDKFRRGRANDWSSPPELFVAQMLIDPPAEPAAVVELGAAKHDLVYLFDTLRFADEELSCMDKISSGPEFLSSMRVANTLSVTPIGRDRLDLTPPRFRLVDVDLEMANPVGETAELEIRETFEILEPTWVLDLQLISRRIGDRTEFPYELRTVTVVDGEPAPFVHRKNHLLVQLPRKMKAGDKVSLEFTTRGDVLYRPHDDNYWELRTMSWLPLPERIDMQFFTYHAVIKVPQPFVSFSPGKTVRRWEAEGFNWAEFRSEQPVLFPVILAGKYHSFEQTHEGVTIQVHAYAQAKTARMKEMTNNLFALMEFFGKVLGDYPYEELKVIEINELGWGQAPPGVIFITREAFVQGTRMRGWSVNVNARLAHELAHTWWGDISPWAASHDQWLSESTADYYAAVAMGVLWREQEFEDALREWETGSRWVGDTSSIFLANQLSGGEWWRDRQALLYSKGPLVLHALRQEMGDNAFFTAFKTLLTNHRYKHLHTRDAIAIVNWVSKKDYTDWMNRYLFGTEFPDFSAKGKNKESR